MPAPRRPASWCAAPCASRSERENRKRGPHVTDRALVTCVVFEPRGRQIHFIDGADGGYARAASAMKERLRARADAASA